MNFLKYGVLQDIFIPLQHDSGAHAVVILLLAFYACTFTVCFAHKHMLYIVLRLDRYCTNKDCCLQDYSVSENSLILAPFTGSDC